MKNKNKYSPILVDFRTVQSEKVKIFQLFKKSENKAATNLNAGHNPRFNPLLNALLNPQSSTSLYFSYDRYPRIC
jgi:hypothetical protein